MPSKTLCVDDYIVTLHVKTHRFKKPKCRIVRTFNGSGKNKSVCHCQKNMDKKKCQSCPKF